MNMKTSKRLIYHFINNKALAHVKENPYLFPEGLQGRSDPYWASEHFYEYDDGYKEGYAKRLPPHVLDITKGKNYLVGIPVDGIKGWARSGLLKLLMDPIMFFPYKNVRLTIELPSQERCFVRDLRYMPPYIFRQLNMYKIEEGKSKKRLREISELAGIDFDNEGRLTSEEIKKELNLLYYRSSIDLKEYDGGYDVPELWVPYKIPLKCVVEEKSLDNPNNLIEKAKMKLFGPEALRLTLAAS